MLNFLQIWMSAIRLLFIPHVGAMTSPYDRPEGVPIEASVITVLTDATKWLEVR